MSELCEIRESFLPRKFPVCICESKDVHVYMYLSILSRLCKSYCTHNLSVYNQSRTSKEERFTNLSVTNVYIYSMFVLCGFVICDRSFQSQHYSGRQSFCCLAQNIAPHELLFEET